MAKVYKSICAEIDDLAVKIIHLSEKFIIFKLQVEGIMDDGYVNIAKARYIMGSKCVSTLQLPTMNSNPIKPLATVCRGYHNDHWVFKVDRRKPSPLPSDEKLLKDKIGNDTSRADVIRDLLGQEAKNLRKRKEFYLVEDNSYAVLNDELQDEVSTNSSESTESLISFFDPIRLFGVLVPYTLRMAQKNFQEVLNVLLDCATIQSQTQVILERYYHLVRVKRLIEKSAEERGFDLSEEKAYWTPSDEYSDVSYHSELTPIPGPSHERFTDTGRKEEPGESDRRETEIGGEGYVIEEFKYFEASAPKADDDVHEVEIEGEAKIEASDEGEEYSYENSELEAEK